MTDETSSVRADALQMSRDLTSLVDRQQQDPSGTSTDTAVRDYVRALLRQYRADEDARMACIFALEAGGRRIVGGGQIGQDSWEITDWRTGELLANGTGGIDDYDAATARLDPDGKWLHIDTINVEPDSVEPTSVEPVGIPASLADTLQDWLGSSSTPDEDVAQFVAWSVEEVAHHREAD
jgi:hypothetical protein